MATFIWKSVRTTDPETFGTVLGVSVDGTHVRVDVSQEALQDATRLGRNLQEIAERKITESIRAYNTVPNRVAIGTDDLK